MHFGTRAVALRGAEQTIAYPLGVYGVRTIPRIKQYKADFYTNGQPPPATQPSESTILNVAGTMIVISFVHG
jgi:hypothetical protein